jgi:sigma-E factor negative regulatory protein RseB
MIRFFRQAPCAGWRTVAGTLALAAWLIAPAAFAQDAAQWLARVAQAARTLNYVGTVVYQYGGRVETSRLIHLNEDGQEWEKLVSLDGPAREIIRTSGEVRCYYPDAKIVRVEPRTFRNVFPSLSAEQIRNLSQFYDFRIVTGERIAGHTAHVVTFEPKDGLRYGHKFWSDATTGLLLKARLVNEKGEVVEQFAFTDLTVNVKIDRDMVKPSWATLPPDWQVKQASGGEMVPHDTGWSVSKLPPGFTKIMEGFRPLRGKREPIAHIVYSDGLVAISVFVEPAAAAAAPPGLSQQGGLNVYSTKSDDYLVTVLGEAPPATVRLIAQSVGRR